MMETPGFGLQGEWCAGDGDRRAMGLGELEGGACGGQLGANQF
jgi:hypothetical protein